MLCCWFPCTDLAGARDSSPFWNVSRLWHETFLRCPIVPSSTSNAIFGCNARARDRHAGYREKCKGTRENEGEMNQEPPQVK